MDQLHDKFLSMMNVIGSDDETRAELEAMFGIGGRDEK